MESNQSNISHNTTFNKPLRYGLLSTGFAVLLYILASQESTELPSSIGSFELLSVLVGFPALFFGLPFLVIGIIRTFRRNNNSIQSSDVLSPQEIALSVSKEKSSKLHKVVAIFVVGFLAWIFLYIYLDDKKFQVEDQQRLNLSTQSRPK